MKTLIIALLLIVSAGAQVLSIDTIKINDHIDRLFDVSEGTWITDSTAWEVTDTLNVGKEKCAHVWIEGDWGYHFQGCAVYHANGHCDLDYQYKHRICKSCLRKEKLREFIYEHFEESEYSKLNKQIKE